MLDQLDEEFGIGNLVKEEIHTVRNTAYTEKNLKGLKVEHNVVSITIYYIFNVFFYCLYSIYIFLKLSYILNKNYSNIL